MTIQTYGDSVFQPSSPTKTHIPAGKSVTDGCTVCGSPVVGAPVRHADVDHRIWLARLALDLAEYGPCSIEESNAECTVVRVALGWCAVDLVFEGSAFVGTSLPVYDGLRGDATWAGLDWYAEAGFLHADDVAGLTPGRVLGKVSDAHRKPVEGLLRAV